MRVVIDVGGICSRLMVMYLYACINFISTGKCHDYINNALPESYAYI